MAACLRAVEGGVKRATVVDGRHAARAAAGDVHHRRHRDDGRPGRDREGGRQHMTHTEELASPLVGRDDEQLQDAAGRARPRRGRHRLGRRQPRVHRPARRHRDDDPRPRAPEGRRGDHGAGARSSGTSPTWPCTSRGCCSPSGCSSWPAGPDGSSSATPAPRPTRRPSRSAGCTGRPEVITAEGAFHGRTMGALALTGQPSKAAAFAPLPGGVHYVPYGDADALARGGGGADRDGAARADARRGRRAARAGRLPGRRRSRPRRTPARCSPLDEVQTGIGPHRLLVHAPGRRPPARRDHPGQGAGRRTPDGRRRWPSARRPT